MPLEFLERLPVPNFRVYTTISFAVLSCSIYYATQIIKNPAWRTNHTHVDVETHPGDDVDLIDPRSLGTHLKELLECMVVEPVCIWVGLFEINQCTLEYAKVNSNTCKVSSHTHILLLPLRYRIHSNFSHLF